MVVRYTLLMSARPRTKWRDHGHLVVGLQCLHRAEVFAVLVNAMHARHVAEIGVYTGEISKVILEFAQLSMIS